MIKIRFYLLFVMLLGVTVLSVSGDALHESNWLSIVQQRLELEQKPVSLFLKEVNEDKKKSALDDAVLFYKNKFESLYNELMVIFKENDNWKSLREYLFENNKFLDVKYDKLRRDYATKFADKSKFSDTQLAKYESNVKSYYETMMDILKKVITEGQEKEVELRNAEIKKLRVQERRRKMDEQSAIWNEEE